MGINTLINSLPGGVSTGAAVNAAQQGQVTSGGNAKGVSNANRIDKTSSETGADSFSTCLGSSLATEGAPQAGTETVATEVKSLDAAEAALLASLVPGAVLPTQIVNEDLTALQNGVDAGTQKAWLSEIFAAVKEQNQTSKLTGWLQQWVGDDANKQNFLQQLQGMLQKTAVVETPPLHLREALAEVMQNSTVSTPATAEIQPTPVKTATVQSQTVKEETPIAVVTQQAVVVNDVVKPAVIIDTAQPKQNASAVEAPQTTAQSAADSDAAIAAAPTLYQPQGRSVSSETQTEKGQTSDNQAPNVESAAATNYGVRRATSENTDSAASFAGQAFSEATAQKLPVKAEAQTETDFQPIQAALLQHTVPKVQTEATAAVTSAASTVSDPHGVFDQMVAQARMIRMPDSTEMVIRLRPEHLGELVLKVAVDAAGTVNATFHSSNAEVRAVLEANLQQFRQEMQQQGVRVQGAAVYAGLGDTLPQQQQGQQGGTSQGKGTGVLAEEKLEPVDLALDTGDAAVDYRV
nr:flagellar hook-length control protein FliK [uncultured Anaeromusa sp.]